MTDEENQFDYEENYSYKNGRLIRYVKRSDLSDSMPNEVRQYNDFGKMIIYQTHSKGANSVYTWKFKYNPDGFLFEEQMDFGERLGYLKKYLYLP